MVRRLHRSAAFWLTLRFAAYFVMALLAAGLLAGMGTAAYLAQDARSRAASVLEELVAAAELDTQGIPALLDARAVELQGEQLEYGYQSSAGVQLHGGIGLAQPEEGWSSYLPPGSEADEVLWVVTRQLPDGGWLSIGASKEHFLHAIEAMQAGALWTIAIAGPLALFSGALLSRIVLSRLDALVRTADAVRAGDASVRAPLSGTGDEFDRLADALNLMLDRSETLTRNLRNISAGIAHELRTPLSRLKLRLGDLAAGTGTAEERQAAIARSADDIGQTLKVFDALLQIGQIEADAGRTGFARLDLSELLSELAEIYAPVAEESGRSLVVTISPAVTVAGNRELLTRMAVNLLDNALAHTQPGTTVTLALTGGAQPVLQVSDDGPGIPEEIGDRVFERFVHGNHREVGAGLGLALVRSICAVHNFEPTLEHGAVGADFRIRMTAVS